MTTNREWRENWVNIDRMRQFVYNNALEREYENLVVFKDFMWTMYRLGIIDKDMMVVASSVHLMGG